MVKRRPLRAQQKSQSSAGHRAVYEVARRSRAARNGRICGPQPQPRVLQQQQRAARPGAKCDRQQYTSESAYQSEGLEARVEGGGQEEATLWMRLRTKS